jgi:hypothetical protein
METKNLKRISPYPNFGEKTALRTSTSTTLRHRPPTNPHTDSKIPNFVFDYSDQKALWPDRNPNALIENTQNVSPGGYKTINRSGHPFALGVNVGGSPDDRGTSAISRGPRAKFTK